MSARRILCEGPDDVAAVREIVTRYLGGTRQAVDGAGGPAGADRRVDLKFESGVSVVITAGKQGKSGLPKDLATLLGTLSPFDGGVSGLDGVMVLFDPDGETEEQFHGLLEGAVAEHAPDWSIQPKQGDIGTFVARRQDHSVLVVRALAWRADGPVLDGLGDEQNLERVLCRVLTTAYPGYTGLIDTWLGEIGTRLGKPPRWKAAIHLYCALLDATGMPVAQFLGQDPTCSPHVADVLAATGWMEAFRKFLEP